MIRAQINLIGSAKPIQPGGNSLDSDAISYFTRVESAGGVIDNPVKTAFSDFVKALKLLPGASGTEWDSIKELWIPLHNNNASITPTLVKAKYPGGKSASLTNVSFVAADYVKSTGLKGNGSGKRLTSDLVPNDVAVDNMGLLVAGDSFLIDPTNFAGIIGAATGFILNVNTSASGELYLNATNALSMPGVHVVNTGITIYNSIALNDMKGYVRGINTSVSTSSRTAWNIATPISLFGNAGNFRGYSWGYAIGSKFSAVNMLAIETEFKKVLTALGRTFVNIVFEGDSQTKGASATICYTSQTLKKQARQFSQSNLGVAGQTTVSMNANKAVKYPSVIDSNSIFMLYGGTNDINTGLTAAATWANLLSIINYAKSFGVTKIAVGTMTPINGLSAPNEIERLSLNTLIRNNAVAEGYGIMEFANNASLTTWSGTYYGDSIHWNAAGTDIVSTIASNLITARGWNGVPANTLLPSISYAGQPSYAKVGDVLTASTGTFTNSPSSYTYRWYRNGVFITGETNSTYTAVEADSEYGVLVTVGVIATNALGSSVESISVGIGVVVLNPASYALKYWAADNSYQDDPLTIPALNGDPVLSIREQVGGVHHLDWTGTTVGAGVEKQNDNDYGDTQPYPKFYAIEGGFVHIRNATPKQYQTNGGSMNLSGDITVHFLIRLTGGTDNEYFFFISNGPSMRDRDEATGNNTQIGALNTLIEFTAADRVLDDIVYGLTHIKMHFAAVGTAAIVKVWVNNVQRGDPAGTAVGANVMGELCFGSNSHNANVTNFLAALYLGVPNAVVDGKLLKLWEAKHGVLGSYPKTYPIITYNPGGVYNDKETWNAGDSSVNIPAYVFNSPTGAAEGASEFRFYISSSSTQATALTQRTYVTTHIVGIHPNPGKFIRGVDFTGASVYCWVEAIGVDINGVRQVIETQTHGLLLPP